MSDDAEKPKASPKFVKIKDGSKPLTFHPLTTEEALSALLRVKPPVRPATPKK